MAMIRRKFLGLILAGLLASPSSHAARVFTAASSNEIVIPSSTRWTTKISASAWINVAALPGTDVTYQILTDTNGAGQMAFSFRIENEGGTQKIKWAFNSSFANYVTFSINSTLSTNTWNHIAWTYDSSDTHSYIYVNGTQNAAGTSSAVAGSSTGSNARIGSRYWGGSTDGYFNGTIGPVALWTDVTVLNQLEVSALANGAQADRVRLNPTRYYLLEGWQTTEPDYGVAHQGSTSISGTSRANGPPVLPR